MAYQDEKRLVTRITASPRLTISPKTGLWLAAVLMLAYASLAMTEFVQVIIDIESNSRRTRASAKPGSTADFLQKIS